MGLGALIAKRLRSNTTKRALLIALTVLVLLALVTPSSALPITRKTGDGKFHVVGPNIIGPNGGVFTPRGVNLGGLEWSPKGYDLGFWNFRRMKEWGANFVRVAIADNFWLKSMCTYDKSYAAKVDDIVRWAEALKMLVLLDNHYGTKGQTCGTGKWANLQKLPDIHNLSFAKQLAKRYKDRPYVAIDLYNEPHDISDEMWRNGGVVDGYRGVGMQQLLDGVRSTGYTNLVFATGNYWGNDLRMVVNQPLANDKNVVYAAHSYPYWCDGRLFKNDPYFCRGKAYPPHLDTEVPPLIGRKAVMLTEFGTYRPFPHEMQGPIEWAEKHGIGWAAWLWCNGPTSNFCLLSDKGGKEPSITGKPVRDALARAKNR